MNPNLLGVDHATATALKRLLNRGIGEENLSHKILKKLDAGNAALEAADAAEQAATQALAAAQVAQEAARAAQEVARPNFSMIISPTSHSQYIITHNLNTKNLLVNFIDNLTNQNVEADWLILDQNTVQVSFGNVPKEIEIKVIIG